MPFCETCQAEMDVDTFNHCLGCGEMAGSPKRTLSEHQRRDAMIAARAQVMWGHPRNRVIGSLTSKGLSEAHAEEVYEAAMAERGEIYRAKGKKMIIAGLAVGLPAGFLILVADFFRHGPAFMFVVLFLILGIFAIAFGSVHLVTGGREGEQLKEDSA